GLLLSRGTYGTVPEVARSIRRGEAPATAFAYLVAAPLLSPVALAATAVAFPGHPALVAGRVLAGGVAPGARGPLWQGWGGAAGRGQPAPSAAPAGHGWPAFWAGWRTDLLRGASALTLAAALVAALTVFGPPSLLPLIAARPAVAAIALALFAVLLCVPAE